MSIQMLLTDGVMTSISLLLIKAPLNFPNAQFVIITKMIVIKDVCSIAKIIPIDPLVTVFFKCEKINNFDRYVLFLQNVNNAVRSFRYLFIFCEKNSH